MAPGEKTSKRVLLNRTFHNFTVLFLASVIFQKTGAKLVFVSLEKLGRFQRDHCFFVGVF